MIVSEDMLSAFLDQQLAPAEQANINAQLLFDEALQRRLGRLYAQHMALKLLTSEIDQDNSADEQILKRLPAKPAKTQFKLVKSGLLSMAASIVLLAGLTLTFFNLQNTTPDSQHAWQITQRYLAGSPSGSYPLENKKTLLLQFSFLDKYESYCRVYDIAEDSWLSSHIACKRGEAWQLVFTAGHALNTDIHYQASSGRELIETQLNKLILGMPFTASEELQHIRKGWVN